MTLYDNELSVVGEKELWKINMRSLYYMMRNSNGEGRDSCKNIWSLERF